MDNVLLVAGVACVIAAVVGGGLDAFGVKVPVLRSTARQVMLGVLGIGLIVGGKYSPSRDANGNGDGSGDGSGEAHPVADFKPADVGGCWVQQNPKMFFMVKQDGKALTSEGALGHGDGTFSGSNNLSFNWKSLGAFKGTVNGDTISWSSNTTWNRLPSPSKACVDVTGHWAHQQLPQTFFTLTQNGDSVISEGSFGHAEGQFTGPDTFSLNWQTLGLFEGTVKDDTITWDRGGSTWKRQN